MRLMILVLLYNSFYFQLSFQWVVSERPNQCGSPQYLLHISAVSFQSTIVLDLVTILIDELVELVFRDDWRLWVTLEQLIPNFLNLVLLKCLLYKIVTVSLVYLLKLFFSHLLLAQHVTFMVRYVVTDFAILYLDRELLQGLRLVIMVLMFAFCLLGHEFIYRLE